MKKVMVVLMCLVFVIGTITCGDAFAQRGVNAMQNSAKMAKRNFTAPQKKGTLSSSSLIKFTQEDTGAAQESAKAVEATEATIPYSAPYNSSKTGADEVAVNEDSE